jgi:hypothetical protein
LGVLKGVLEGMGFFWATFARSMGVLVDIPGALEAMCYAFPLMDGFSFTLFFLINDSHD